MIAFKTGKYKSLYRRLCKPNGLEWAQFLKKHGHFQHIGYQCYISPGATITDPQYVKMGDNVRLSDCTLFGHDGSVNMINRAYGLKLDNVGKIEIGDNVFVSHGVIILPGTKIGSNVIIGAGSVVSSDIPSGVIVSGIPAKTVGIMNFYVSALKKRNKEFPWKELIEKRDGDFDPNIEEELIQRRVAYFYPDNE